MGTNEWVMRLCCNFNGKGASTTTNTTMETTNGKVEIVFTRFFGSNGSNRVGILQSVPNVAILLPGDSCGLFRGVASVQGGRVFRSCAGLLHSIFRHRGSYSVVVLSRTLSTCANKFISHRLFLDYVGDYHSGLRVVIANRTGDSSVTSTTSCIARFATIQRPCRGNMGTHQNVRC